MIQKLSCKVIKQSEILLCLFSCEIYSNHFSNSDYEASGTWMIANKGVKSTRNETQERERERKEKKLKKSGANILQDTGSHGRDSKHTPPQYKSAALRTVTSVPHLPFIQLNFALTTQKAAEIRV